MKAMGKELDAGQLHPPRAGARLAWRRKGRRTVLFLLSTAFILITLSIWRQNSHALEFDPADESSYRGVAEHEAPRCTVGGLCASAALTCAATAQRADPHAARDCQLAGVTKPAQRARIIRSSVRSAWDAYK